MRLRRVVLPAPREPVRTVTGILSGIFLWLRKKHRHSGAARRAEPGTHEHSPLPLPVLSRSRCEGPRLFPAGWPGQAQPWRSSAVFMVSGLLPSARPGMTRPALQRQRRAERLYIVPHHVDVSPSRAVRQREGVGVELFADPRSALTRDALDQAGIGDVFEEHGRDALALDLPDDAGHVLG